MQHSPQKLSIWRG